MRARTQPYGGIDYLKVTDNLPLPAASCMIYEKARESWLYKEI